MGRGPISRRLACLQIISHTPGIHEIYAEKDFDFTQQDVVLYILHTIALRVPDFHFKMAEACEGRFRMYVTTDPTAAMLKGKRIIWRDGEVFV